MHNDLTTCFLRKELNLLQKLYGLYDTVMGSISGYYEILWGDVDIEKINGELQEFQNRLVLIKLPFYSATFLGSFKIKVLLKWGYPLKYYCKHVIFKEICRWNKLSLFLKDVVNFPKDLRIGKLIWISKKESTTSASRVLSWKWWPIRRWSWDIGIESPS